MAQNPLSTLAELAAAGPRLTLRALDDLHTLASVAGEIGPRLALLDSLDESAREVVELGRRIDARADAMVAIGDRVAGQAESVLALGERIDARAEAVIAMGERLEALGTQVNEIGEQMLPEARLVHERAQVVIERAEEMIRILPLVERALTATQPLEGAVERLGKLVNRLPGGAPASVGAPAAERPAGAAPPPGSTS